MQRAKHDFLPIYRALEHNLRNDFFKPLLFDAKEYRIAAGFFTLSGLAELIDLIIPIIKNGGEVSILTSPFLKESDVEKIEKSDYPREYVEKIILNEFEKFTNSDSNLELQLLAALLKEGYIKMRIVYSEKGIFHDKTGFVVTKNNERIAYAGSANLTYNALFSNIESISVYTEPYGKEAIDNTEEYLRKLWNREYPNVKTLEITKAIEDRLLSFKDDDESVKTLIRRIEVKTKEALLAEEKTDLKKVSLRSYQKTAITEFIENDFVHFYEMATGTGKTYTALFALQELQKHLQSSLFTIVILPLIDLMNQWTESAIDAKIPGKIFQLGGGAHQGTPESVFDKALQSYLNGESVTIFAVSNSYQKHSQKFLKSYGPKLKDNLFIVMDEAHNMTNALFDKLPKYAKYRLGLSATPKRNVEEETENLLEYFRGEEYPDTFKYGLEEAIVNNFLSRYYYNTIPVHLTDEEYLDYEILSKRIAVYLNSKDEDDKQKLERTLQIRALLVKKAANKTVVLNKMLLSEDYDFNSSVIYCGPGKLNEEIKLTDAITKMVHSSGKYEVTKFVDKTKNRQRVLKDFASGYYSTMVAIKCFDEGIDIPSLKRIYILSSDNNYRQTVQRRGRVLRLSKETDKKFAEIYDFVVLPPLGVSYRNASSLIENEIKRVIEYASLAENKDSHEYFIDSTIEKTGLIREEIYYYD